MTSAETDLAKKVRDLEAQLKELQDWVGFGSSNPDQKFIQKISRGLHNESRALS